ncbi:MAG: hypothetical protein ABSB74_05645 [Tepidisphaeraceae bacterium]
MTSDKTTNDKGQRTNLSGFTLVEMITVLTIIILVLAIAIPVWNALMGGTNVAAAQNLISAVLANARADAIYNRQTIGVCFFIDPKTNRTAMAEVQAEPEWNGTAFTPLFPPNVYGISNTQNGLVNALELVNNPDPNNPGNLIFYRDIVLLPAGVAVALNNNTYTYNQAKVAGTGNYYFAYLGASNTLPALDRYLRLGAIMFAPDGTLTTIPFGIPLNDHLSSSVGATATENLVCQRLGMVYSGTAYDVASNVSSAGTPSAIPLMSSVGFVVFDHDAYLAQHASMQVNSGGTTTTKGDGNAFTDIDMNYYLYTNLASPTTPSQVPISDDKFIEENWIDKNGVALMVNPTNGSLIKAK